MKTKSITTIHLGLKNTEKILFILFKPNKQFWFDEI